MERLGQHSIRPASREDFVALARLIGQLGYPASSASMAARLTRLLAREDDVVLVAVSDQSVIGGVHATLQTALTAELRVEVRSLVVDLGARGRGVGGSLILAVEAWARQHGSRVVEVRSNVTRERSHEFYPRIGFERVKTSHVYRKLLPTAVGLDPMMLED